MRTETAFSSPAFATSQPGEELTYDYWLYDGEDDAPCYCGSKSCRGSMYSPEELKKKARAEARKNKRAELAAKSNGAAPNHQCNAKRRSQEALARRKCAPARPTPRSYNQNFLP